MSILSMTGFGRGEAQGKQVKITLEISTVNRKQFDCNVAFPRECACLESAFQKLIHQRVTRGYVKGVLTIQPIAGSDGEIALDLQTLQKQVKAVRAAARFLDIPDTLSASDLFRFPDLFHPKFMPDDPASLWPEIKEATDRALDQLTEMRTREGANLADDLRSRLDALKGIAAEIRALSREVPGNYRIALEKRLADLMGQGSAVDPELLAQEVAIFADRADISEEMTRIESHFDQAEKILAEGGACGRTLDFLCQEFFREINTTGSKANNTEISTRVIAFKAGLEAIREQVQNIE